jgi:hypothetical protein
MPDLPPWQGYLFILFAKLVALVYNIPNSFGLGYYKLFKSLQTT